MVYILGSEHQDIKEIAPCHTSAVNIPPLWKTYMHDENIKVNDTAVIQVHCGVNINDFMFQEAETYDGELAIRNVCWLRY